MLFCLYLQITKLQICAASPAFCSRSPVCTGGGGAGAHVPWWQPSVPVCCQKLGKRCWQRQELTSEDPHRVSVCGVPMFSGRPLSIQGSAVHREGLVNVCFAECSDNWAQLMVWASETWKLEGDSRSPQYRMGETRLGKEADLCGQLRFMHLGVSGI